MTDLGKQPPAAGGRVQFKLIEQSPLGAAYHVTLSTPDEQWSGKWFITALAGDIEGEIGAAPPVWLDTFARAVARSLYRLQATQGWPRRITRWRKGANNDSEAL